MGAAAAAARRGQAVSDQAASSSDGEASSGWSSDEEEDGSAMVGLAHSMLAALSNLGGTSAAARDPSGSRGNREGGRQSATARYGCLQVPNFSMSPVTHLGNRRCVRRN